MTHKIVEKIVKFTMLHSIIRHISNKLIEIYTHPHETVTGHYYLASLMVHTNQP